MIGVPTLYRMMLEHDRLDQYDLSSVEYWYSAGDVLPVEVGKRWQERFGKTIYQGYGATETCGGVAMCPVNVRKPAQERGPHRSQQEIKLVDPHTLEPVNTEPGELLVSSEHMVTSYLNKPEETEEAFVELDGEHGIGPRTSCPWTRRGISSSSTGRGHHQTQGIQVSASEIEAVLQEHPAVIGSCVVGYPGPEGGRAHQGLRGPQGGRQGDHGVRPDQVVPQQLVSYKVPQYIEFRDMLPKSKGG
jgi:long-chain acyl-CoA synthetase